MRRIVLSEHENKEIPQVLVKPLGINPIDIVYPEQTRGMIYVPQKGIFIFKEPMELDTGEDSNIYYNFKAKEFEHNPEARVDWYNTHFILASKGLFMPTPSVFLQHYLNARDAVLGKNKLYNGEGEELDFIETLTLWYNLTSTESKFGGIFLDGLFEKRKNGRAIMIDDHRVIFDKKGYPLLRGRIRNLEKVLENKESNSEEETNHILLDFDEYGLPKRYSPVQEYIPGITLKYKSPKNGSIAGFWVGEGYVGELECTADETNNDATMKVLPCAYTTRNEEATPVNY